MTPPHLLALNWVLASLLMPSLAQMAGKQFTRNLRSIIRIINMRSKRVRSGFIRPIILPGRFALLPTRLGIGSISWLLRMLMGVEKLHLKYLRLLPLIIKGLSGSAKPIPVILNMTMALIFLALAIT